MKRIICFFLVADAISWLVWLPLYGSLFGINIPFYIPFNHAVGALGPMIAAFMLIWFESGRQGIKDLLKRIFKWNVHPGWYFMALLSPFLIFLVATLLSYFLNKTPISFNGFGKTNEFPSFSLAGFFIYNLLSFGFGEETGWRGYALPKLQSKYSALTSTFLLSIGWAIWHIPLFLYRPGYTSMQFTDIIGWYLSILTGAILLTWLYNNTKGSILICAIFHASIDIAFTSDHLNKNLINYEGILITLFGLGALILSGAKNLSKQERQKI